jgi:hypothetical protein
MKARRAVLAAVLLIVVLAVGLFGRVGYAPSPSRAKLANSLPPEQLSNPMIRDGRAAFYRETFGNEVFLTDVLGLLDGGLSVSNMSRALLALGGRGTSDLKVRLAKDVQVGPRLYRKDELIATGLDVPRGAVAPLGIKILLDRGQIKAGITCALCHSTVNAEGRVVEGAPNADINAGLLLALASNSSAYFAHTTMPSLQPYLDDPKRVAPTRSGRTARLPNPDRLEADVDAMLGAWPRGNFDSTVDLVNDPSSIPTSFTRDAHPYGWTGFAGLGRFDGLSALNNNVHALNSDETAQVDAAPILFKLDPEVYLATLLQRAPRAAFRYSPGTLASARLARADPTPGAPGLNSYAVLPTYPRPNYATTNSLVASRRGEPTGYAIDAMSAFQNALSPPLRSIAAKQAQGRDVFARAGCGACHTGPALTNNRVLPAELIQTEPTRARALAALKPFMAQPVWYGPKTPFPVPPKTPAAPVKMKDPSQTRLAWAHDPQGRGGYKVPSLIGLVWSAPYLHDGGVAMGIGPSAFGVPGTLGAGRIADPTLSLDALLSQSQRARVMAANRADPRLALAHVTGQGHPFWVDAPRGFSQVERQALIVYLLGPSPPAR